MTTTQHEQHSDAESGTNETSLTRILFGDLEKEAREVAMRKLRAKHATHDEGT